MNDNKTYVLETIFIFFYCFSKMAGTNQKNSTSGYSDTFIVDKDMIKKLQQYQKRTVMNQYLSRKKSLQKYNSYDGKRINDDSQKNLYNQGDNEITNLLNNLENDNNNLDKHCCLSVSPSTSFISLPDQEVKLNKHEDGNRARRSVSLEMEYTNKKRKGSKKRPLLCV